MYSSGSQTKKIENIDVQPNVMINKKKKKWIYFNLFKHVKFIIIDIVIDTIDEWQKKCNKGLKVI